MRLILLLGHKCEGASDNCFAKFLKMVKHLKFKLKDLVWDMACSQLCLRVQKLVNSNAFSIFGTWNGKSCEVIDKKLTNTWWNVS